MHSNLPRPATADRNGANREEVDATMYEPMTPVSPQPPLADPALSGDADRSGPPGGGRAAGMAVLAACLGMFVGPGITINYAAGVFIPAIIAETGWSRSAVTAAIAPAAFAIAVMSLVVGVLTDRFGPRRILVPASIAYAASLAIIPLISGTPLLFTMGLTLAAVFSAAMTPVAYGHLIIGWLPERRGIAMGAALAASGLGIAIIPALIGALLPAVGWRTGYALLGLLAFLIVVPSSFWLVRDPPRAQVARPLVQAPAGGHHEAGLSFGEAARMPAFWTLGFAFLLNGLTATAGAISLPLVAQDFGVSPGLAATTMVSVGASMVVSRIVVGALFDRYSPILLAALIFLTPALGYLILMTGLGMAGFFAAALLFGIAVGTEGDAMAVILSRRFGMRSFGKIFGLNFGAYATCGGLGPWLMNLLRTEGGSDRFAFSVLACCALSAVLLMATNRSNRLSHP